MSLNKIRRLSQTSLPPTIIHIVEPGDTLCSLAVKFNTSLSALCSLNCRALGLGVSCREILVFPGMELRVPDPSSQPPTVPSPTEDDDCIIVTKAESPANQRPDPSPVSRAAAPSAANASFSDQQPASIDAHSLGWTLLDPESEVPILPGRADLPLPRLLPSMSLENAVLSAAPDLLTAQRLSRLVELLPPRAEGLDLGLLFCTRRHGHSLRTLYERVSVAALDPATCCLLLVVGDAGMTRALLGAFIPCPVRQPAAAFYGTGETFVFRFANFADDHSDSDVDGFQAFHPSRVGADDCGSASMFVRSSRDGLAVGSGPALALHSDLLTGSSRACGTFNSPPLFATDGGSSSTAASAAPEEFRITCAQLWTFLYAA